MEATLEWSTRGKKLNSPIPHDKLDFSNGIVPVVKKSSSITGCSTGEVEDHTMKLFQRMDRQGKGYLSALDLKRGMKLIGLSLTNEQVEQLIVEMDDNGDGKIQPEELSAAIHEGGRNPKVVNVRKVALFLHKVPRQKSPGEVERGFHHQGPRGIIYKVVVCLIQATLYHLKSHFGAVTCHPLKVIKKLTHRFRMISWTFQMELFQS